MFSTLVTGPCHMARATRSHRGHTRACIIIWPCWAVSRANRMAPMLRAPPPAPLQPSGRVTEGPGLRACIAICYPMRGSTKSYNVYPCISHRDPCTRSWGSWGPLGHLFGGLWPPSGASWGRPSWGGLGASSGFLEGFLVAKAPKMPPRPPKTPPGGLPNTPRGLPEAPQRRPRGLPEAPDSRHCRCYVLCFHQGQAECAKRLNNK